jgi:hypothetical protein
LKEKDNYPGSGLNELHLRRCSGNIPTKSLRNLRAPATLKPGREHEHYPFRRVGT